MPRGDRSGPDGRGPRGGVCVGAGQSRSFGYGRAGGRNMRRGTGMGMGMGMGMRAGFGAGYAGAYPVNLPSEKEALEGRTEELERELAALKTRLGQLSETSEG